MHKFINVYIYVCFIKSLNLICTKKEFYTESTKPANKYSLTVFVFYNIYCVLKNDIRTFSRKLTLSVLWQIICQHKFLKQKIRAKKFDIVYLLCD